MRLAILGALAALLALLPQGLAADQGAPHLDHVFLIILENHDYCQLIASPASAVPNECATGDNANPLHDAPFLNALAAKNGVATAYFGTSHPSEPNYVSLGGGNYFGIQDDDDYACPNGPSPNSVGCTSGSAVVAGDTAAGNSACGCDVNYPNHTIYGDNLAQELDSHGRAWKAYNQSLPSAGFTGNCSPGTSGNCFYASKHNPVINFASVQANDLNKIVPMDQFVTDLKSGHVPDLSLLVPDQCNDMHGQRGCTAANIDTADCGVTGGCQPCTGDPGCIEDGDAYTKYLVNAIRSSDTWKHGSNAIFITVDEGNTNLGCCDAATKDDAGGGGGNVAEIVITNHDARHPDQNDNGFSDPTPYNHYSWVATILDSFGLPCVQNTCDTAHVKPMTPLLRDP